MLIVTLTNIASGESLNLDEIAREGKGVEAVSGMTGLGLPPVDVQWFEGAGDGARARSYRVTPRDIDIPLHVFTDTRAELKQQIARISRVMSGPMRLDLIDDEDGSHVYAEVLRVGNGTYTYGSDSTGDNEWQAIVTLRAGDPYWRHAEVVGPLEQVGTYGQKVSRTFSVANPGTAEAWPTYELFGPLKSFSVDVAGGEKLTWSGQLNRGETITIDTEAGTVTDATGASRYSGLSAAPLLSPLPAGNVNVAVELESLTASGRTNYVNNPSFRKAHDWSTNNPGRVSQPNQTLQVGKVDATIPYDSQNLTYVLKSFQLPTALAGQAFQLRYKLRGANPITEHNGPVWTGLRAPTSIVASGGAVSQYQHSNSPDAFEVVHDFIVPADGGIAVAIYEGYGYGGVNASYFGPTPLIVDEVYVGLPGPYFDGATPDDSSSDYAWAGVADASFSTVSQVSVPPKARLSFKPRDWMVV